MTTMTAKSGTILPLSSLPSSFLHFKSTKSPMRGIERPAVRPWHADFVNRHLLRLSRARLSPDWDKSHHGRREEYQFRRPWLNDGYALTGPNRTTSHRKTNGLIINLNIFTYFNTHTFSVDNKGEMQGIDGTEPGRLPGRPSKRYWPTRA